MYCLKFFFQPRDNCEYQYKTNRLIKGEQDVNNKQLK